MKFRFIFLRQIFFKIIFIDKYLVKKFRKKDIGIIKIKETISLTYQNQVPHQLNIMPP